MEECPCLFLGHGLWSRAAPGVCVQGYVPQLNFSLTLSVCKMARVWPAFGGGSAVDGGPESGSCASKMAIEVFRKRLDATRGLFPSSSCKVFPSWVKSALVILYILMFVRFAV